MADFEVGDAEDLTLTVDPYDGTTTVTLSALLPDRTTADLEVPDGDGGVWTRSVTYTMSGLWYLTWSVDGTGGPKTVEVRRRVTGSPATLRRSYATSKNLSDWLDASGSGTDVPLDADRQLAHATELVDRELLSAVYAVDADGDPTQDKVIAALRDATCAWVEWWLEGGDEHGTQAVVSSASIGSVSVGRAANVTPPLGQYVTPARVRVILADAGLAQHPYG
ncbi:MAG: hypothetical protein EPO06_12075 [Burkholderiaceae bacterium]|nr:MAG: hypothetical protein EPO06_12075 [Burkholderiaceae bacterium]